MTARHNKGFCVLADMAGKRFGRLLVIERAPDRISANGTHSVMWKVICECGTETTKSGASMRDGSCRSCGCYAAELTRSRVRKHGRHRTPTYQIWIGMRRRCDLPSVRAYPRYGGRGIRVCDRWQSFANFLADMGERPGNLQLDRINNDGHYEPGNCRWATSAEQNKNRCDTHFVTINGETKCISDWAKFVGLSRSSIHYRLRRGWTPQDAIMLPATKPQIAHR